MWQEGQEVGPAEHPPNVAGPTTGRPTGLHVRLDDGFLSGLDNHRFTWSLCRAGPRHGGCRTACPHNRRRRLTSNGGPHPGSRAVAEHANPSLRSGIRGRVLFQPRGGMGTGLRLRSALTPGRGREPTRLSRRLASDAARCRAWNGRRASSEGAVIAAVGLANGP